MCKAFPHSRDTKPADMQGGWETDETVNGAAARETLEEAGVRGIIEVSPFPKKQAGEIDTTL